ncbi:unnamed protein product [Tilletia controversa]|uniref:Uncharacterized protein n=3 Tax=Tilletia TaxID=13289 RepID=A0A8X7MWM2_9BASI|nr:hypothetical protein CF336_g1511 [Tilletia laevis]KAE8202015.1 hypothetical protein CF328_g2461 [Tilletia controversa]KAE8264137.1 hypothetical protein A4X03_0g1169 [Tilletia caries]KAE8206538.1 hypothetical protein CF335_g1806 [Tilletia laevis]KAE8249940.1 hypothetical protein A4X06_0g3000 [Tilletia controversa]
MGVVFSTLGTALSWIGTALEMSLLAIGEIASVLVRGIFTIIVGLCDVLAAISCCCRRPWSRRPSRGPYDGQYDTILNVGGEQVLKKLAQQPVKEKKVQETKSDEVTILTPAVEVEKPATTPSEPFVVVEETAPGAASPKRRLSIDSLKRGKKEPSQTEVVATSA